MCLLRLLIEALPLFPKEIAPLLSCYRMFSKTSHPWAFNQYLVRIMSGIQSYTAGISVSVEICVLSFCFVELTIINPLHIDKPPPVWPLMFGCTANDPPIHNFSMQFLLELRIIGRFLVYLIYLIIWTNLTQLSLSGYLTLVVRNKIAVQVSVLDCLVKNKILPPGDKTPQIVWH